MRRGHSRLGPGLLALALIVAAAPAGAADSYRIDPAHADVAFAVDHLGFSKVWGRFDGIDGTLVLDEAAPEHAILYVVLQAASIDTGHATRDEQLRGPDFLDAARYPAIVFRSSKVERVGERTARIYGALTLHGVTRPVMLFARLNKIAEHPLRPASSSPASPAAPRSGAPSSASRPACR